MHLDLHSPNGCPVRRRVGSWKLILGSWKLEVVADERMKSSARRWQTIGKVELKEFRFREEERGRGDSFILLILRHSH